MAFLSQFVGRPVFELLPEDPSEPGGTARTRLAMEQAITEKRAITVPPHRYTLAYEGGVLVAQSEPLEDLTDIVARHREERIREFWPES